MYYCHIASAFSLTSTFLVPWVVYLAICAFNPRIPPTIDPRMKEPDHTIKNSALWMWREAAMRIDNPRFAMVFWERFMLTYFECCAMHATKSTAYCCRLALAFHPLICLSF